MKIYRQSWHCNIRLYERTGYVTFRQTDMLEAGYRLIYMEKQAQTGGKF